MHVREYKKKNIKEGREIKETKDRILNFSLSYLLNKKICSHLPWFVREQDYTKKYQLGSLKCLLKFGKIPYKY